MKKYFSLICLFCLMLHPMLLHAQNESTELNGFWKFDYRFLVGEGKEDVPYYNIFSRLRLKLHSDISDNVAVEVSGDFRLYGDSNILTVDDYTDPEAQYITDAMLWEAYLDLYDLGIDGLDLRIGKQRIAWGTADKLNQTDNLNPDDFSDIFDFGEHVPSLALRLTYTMDSGLAFEFVWLPEMKPMLFPRDESLSLSTEYNGMMSQLFSQYSAFLANMTIAESNITVNSLPYDLSHSMQAFRIKGTVFKTDFSISYLHGYDDLAVPESITVYLDESDPSIIQSDVELGYYGYHVLGFDFAGDLAGLGWWAEGAVFFPEDDVIITLNMPDLTNPVNMLTTAIPYLDTTPYFKYTIGGDYTFSSGTYLNFQYMHGMFTERGSEENINDYFFLDIEQDCMHDKLKLTLVVGGAVTDWDDIENNYGLFLNSEIMWKPFDGVELALGAYLIDAEGNSFFSSIKDIDMIYLNTKVDF